MFLYPARRFLGGDITPTSSRTLSGSRPSSAQRDLLGVSAATGGAAGVGVAQASSSGLCTRDVGGACDMETSCAAGCNKSCVASVASVATVPGGHRHGSPMAQVAFFKFVAGVATT